jgi:flagellar biosynthesis chaperone FliJ
VTFKFRAAAALDVRRKEEDAARILVAKAESAVVAAQARLREAEVAVADERRTLADMQRQGSEAWRLQWHRTWIEKQRGVALDRAAEVAARRTDAGKAALAAKEAVKKRRVLERLRDRALHRHQRAEHERHLREMNELATLRFVARLAEEGGTRAD